MSDPFILPEKSRVLEIAESIGNTMLAPAIADAKEAERLLAQLIDECYRQRDEIERLQAENAALKQRLEIDDAMVERACEVFPKWPGLTLMYAALEAALNGGE